MYTSAHTRAILSTKHVLSEYNHKLPVHIMLQIHETGGVYVKGKTFPGLNIKQIHELMPDIIIPEDCKLTEKGWFMNEAPETV